MNGDGRGSILLSMVMTLASFVPPNNLTVPKRWAGLEIDNRKMQVKGSRKNLALAG